MPGLYVWNRVVTASRTPHPTPPLRGGTNRSLFHELVGITVGLGDVSSASSLSPLSRSYLHIFLFFYLLLLLNFIYFFYSSFSYSLIYYT